MTDHRRIQRSLFRMQLDAGFARRLRAGDASAVASTGLDGEGLRWLVDADPSAVSADRDGARRRQFLSNVSSEFPLCAALRADFEQLIEGFPSSVGFHEAVCADASLPLALAGYLEMHAESGQGKARDPAYRQLLALEACLVRVRRAPGSAASLEAGEVVMAPWARLLEVSEGTFDLATRIRVAIDAGRAVSAADRTVKSGREMLLVCAAPDPDPFRPRHPHVETLSDGVAALLALASAPLSVQARREFALDCDADAEDIEALVAGFVEERVLLTLD